MKNINKIITILGLAISIAASYASANVHFIVKDANQEITVDTQVHSINLQYKNANDSNPKIALPGTVSLNIDGKEKISIPLSELTIGAKYDKVSHHHGLVEYYHDGIKIHSVHIKSKNSSHWHYSYNIDYTSPKSVYIDGIPFTLCIQGTISYERSHYHIGRRGIDGFSSQNVSLQYLLVEKKDIDSLIHDEL